jgi:hypothetical protein
VDISKSDVSKQEISVHALLKDCQRRHVMCFLMKMMYMRK